jgi:hypothetical protein
MQNVLKFYDIALHNFIEFNVPINYTFQPLATYLFK